MKKKTVIAVLSAFAAVTAFGAGCDKDCKHENWLTKADGGLHYLECEDCGEKKDYALHVDEKNNETQENGADGKCDVCGAEVDNTSYDWKSDDDNHWFEIGGEKVGLGGHLDVLGNDGKCDTCGRVSKITVTFNTDGKCENIVSSVEYGSAVTKPADPKAAGWIFGGWYSDASCKTAYDFTATITSATTVYAKWDMDQTPGHNVENAFTVQLDTEKNANFGTAEKLYFKYTAASTGRYMVYLMGGTADKCAIATDLDEEEYTVKGNDATYFDLAGGESAVLEVTRGADVKDDDVVSVYFSANVNEPLPADGWVSGIYKNGDLSLELDRENKTITWGSLDPVAFSYKGGSIKKVTFTISGATGSATFTLQDNNGILNVTCTKSEYLGGASSLNFEIPAPIVPIPVAKFSGVYTSDSGFSTSATGKVVEIGIYADGTGYFLGADDDRDDFSGDLASFNVNTNTLSFSTNKITLKLDDNGDAESITVGVPMNSEVQSYIYTRTGEVGAKLPEAFSGLESGAIYAGSEYQFTFQDEDTKLGGYQIKIANYDQASSTYTVKVNKTKYLVTIEGTDEVTIKWKDEEGELLDTLTKYAINELPDESVTLSQSDFALNLYHMSVEEEGWYVVETEQTDLAFYVMPDGTSFYFDLSGDVAKTKFEAGKPVYLKAGDILVASKAAYTEDSEPEEFVIAVVAENAPLGYSEDNPLTVTEIGELNVGTKLGGFSYYINYTGLKAGNYLVTISYKSSDSGDLQYSLHYTLNGTNYGYYNGWVGGLSADFHTAQVYVEEGTLSIAIVSNSQLEQDKNDLTVKVEKDFTVAENAIQVNKLGAHNVTIFEFQSSFVTVTAPANQGYLLSVTGEKHHFLDASYNKYGYDEDSEENIKYSLAAGQSVTISIFGDKGTATLIVENDYTINAQNLEFTKIPMGSTIISFANGGATGTSKNFYMPDTDGNEIFVSASGAFTVNYSDGTKKEATAENGSYIVTIPANKGIYFNVTASQSVDLFFATAYGVGSQGNPKNITINGISYKEEVEVGASLYFYAPAGSYSYTTSTYDNQYTTLYINGNEVSGNTFDVKEGDLLCFEVSERVEKAVSLTITALVPKDLRGDYTYTEGSDTKELSIGTNSVTVGGNTYYLSDINGNVYTFTRGEGDNVQRITITAGSQVLLGNTPIVSKTIPASVVGTYTGDSMGYQFSLTINANYTAVYFDGIDSYEDIILSKNGNVYSFSYGEGNCSFTVNDGKLQLNDSVAGNVTLTKAVSIDGTYENSDNRIIVIGNTLSYYHDFSDGFELLYSGGFTEKDGTYSFIYDDWGTDYTATFKVTDGNITSLDDNNYAHGETLIKK